jgi:hypothetical protein
MTPEAAHCHLGLGKLYRSHGQARASAGASDHRDDDVPRDGDAVLAGEGGNVDWTVTEKLIDGPMIEQQVPRLPGYARAAGAHK